MATGTENSGDVARQLRAAADQAVMSIPGASRLGDADFARAMSRVDSSVGLEQRILLVQTYAREIALGNTSGPHNIFDGRDAKLGTAANPNSWLMAGAQAGRFWLGRSDDGDNPSQSRETSSTSSNVSFSDISARNYQHTSFAKAGLNYDTFSALRAQGFGESNILHAAQDTKSNGFDVNNKKLAGAFATLDRDDGARRDERNRLLTNFRAKLDADPEFQRLKDERAKATSPDEIAKLDAKLKARGVQVSKDVGYHGHIDLAPTAAAKKAGGVIEQETISLKAAIGEYSHGNKAEAKAVAEVVRALNRDPNNATALRRYAELEQQAMASSDPSRKAAFEKIKAGVAKVTAGKNEHATANTSQVKANDGKFAEGDDVLAGLNNIATANPSSPVPAKQEDKKAPPTKPNSPTKGGKPSLPKPA